MVLTRKYRDFRWNFPFIQFWEPLESWLSCWVCFHWVTECFQNLHGILRRCDFWSSICQVLNAGVTRATRRNPEQPNWSWAGRNYDSCIVFGVFGMNSNWLMTWLWFAVKKSQVTNEELANKADLGSWFGASISKHLDRMTMGQWVFFCCFLPTKFELCSPQGWFQVDEELRGKGSSLLEEVDLRGYPVLLF